MTTSHCVIFKIRPDQNERSKNHNHLWSVIDQAKSRTLSPPGGVGPALTNRWSTRKRDPQSCPNELATGVPHGVERAVLFVPKTKAKFTLSLFLQRKPQMFLMCNPRVSYKPALYIQRVMLLVPGAIHHKQPRHEQTTNHFHKRKD